MPTLASTAKLLDTRTMAAAVEAAGSGNADALQHSKGPSLLIVADGKEMYLVIVECGTVPGAIGVNSL